MFKTPIALLNFNRPHLTRQVFEVIRQVKPQRLLLVADGPRADRPNDARLCAEVRAIFDEIDWDREVSRNFADSNMGSFKRNSSGLNWVFDTVEEAIILEDDCVPSLSFFPYCEELLERYRNNTKVFAIGGNNFGFPAPEIDSYYFSAFTTIWGWASWRRSWKQIDLNMQWWNSKLGSQILRARFPISGDWKYYYQIYEDIHAQKRRNAWDYQFLLACFKNSQVSIIPRINLISNIGFGVDAANCTDASSPWQNFPRGEIELPLIHPTEVQHNLHLDHTIFTILNGKRTILQRVKSKLLNIFQSSRSAPK